MRTAQVLKIAAYGVVVFGTGLALKYYPVVSLEFGAVIFICFLLWLILRLLAIVGQLVYEARNESARILGNIERQLNYSNALTKEIQDLIDSGRVNKNS